MKTRSIFAAALEGTAPSERLCAPLPATRLPRAVARERATIAAARLAEEPRVRLVFLFGSTAAPDRENVRDIDLGIWTETALDLRELLRLREKAERGLGLELDLVLLNEASVVLAWEVVKYGECLYAADPDEELQFVTRSKHRYWDFKPFLETQWRLTGERLEERLAHGASS